MSQSLILWESAQGNDSFTTDYHLNSIITILEQQNKIIIRKSCHK